VRKALQLQFPRHDDEDDAIAIVTTTTRAAKNRDAPR
jgi:hypothetical protein